jgi:hypothetical protein
MNIKTLVVKILIINILATNPLYNLDTKAHTTYSREMSVHRDEYMQRLETTLKSVLCTK